MFLLQELPKKFDEDLMKPISNRLSYHDTSKFILLL